MVRLGASVDRMAGMCDAFSEARVESLIQFVCQYTYQTRTNVIHCARIQTTLSTPFRELAARVHMMR